MTSLETIAPITSISQSPKVKRHLFHPMIDFLCLGGASIILLPLLYLTPTDTATKVNATLIAVILSFIFNAQHFANSYQIFYRGFHRKAFGRDLKWRFRWRYLMAGLIFPLGLTGFIIYAVLQPTSQMLGYVGNIMLLLIAWHYTKQGYGILIVDSVYKQRYFGTWEKRILRYNSLACWLLFWSLNNYLIKQQNYWSIAYYAIPLPKPFVQLTLVVAFITTLAAVFVLGRRVFSSRRLPLTGTMAYLVTVYVWVFGLVHPIFVLVVPTFHAIQYQAVVWRYQLNKGTGDEAAQLSPIWRLAVFCAFGILLGWLGFWGIPHNLDGLVPYNKEIFGATMFVFIFRAFINIHHFVMDNVIWRGDNPEAAAYLFKN